MPAPISWSDGALLLLDQTALPHAERTLRCRSAEDVADAIRRLVVRGAPAIGVAAAYGLALGMGAGAARARHGSEADVRARFGAVAELLGGTRPTAVNLGWAIARAREVVEHAAGAGPAAVADALLELAHRTLAEQVEADTTLAAHGAALFGAQERVLTHCNTGALATGALGTAGAVIAAAWRAGGVGQVWVDETRPLLQGARLTAWELGRAGVPYRIVPDSSAGALMARGLVDRVVVGADRIAANGDTANKIGTYTLAVLAERHGIPFHVAAPSSTIDRATPSGADIPIEERAADEVTVVGGTRVAPAGARAVNLAFDVTPHALIGAIVTEAGVLRPPFGRSIAEALGAVAA